MGGGHSYFGGGHRFEVPFAIWLEAIATRVEAIPISMEAIALRFLLLVLETIATRVCRMDGANAFSGCDRGTAILRSFA